MNDQKIMLRKVVHAGRHAAAVSRAGGQISEAIGLLNQLRRQLCAIEPAGRQSHATVANKLRDVLIELRFLVNITR